MRHSSESVERAGERAFDLDWRSASKKGPVNQAIAALGYEYNDITGEYCLEGTPGWFHIQYWKMRGAFGLHEYAHAIERIAELQATTGFETCGLKREFLELRALCERRMGSSNFRLDRV